MGYAYSRVSLAADITYRLKDERAAPAGPRFSAPTIDDAIADAIQWAEPLGKVVGETFTSPTALADFIDDNTILDVLDVHARTSTGTRYSLLPVGAWRFQKGDTVPFETINPWVTDTLRLRMVTRVAPDAATIDLDPEMLILYALAVLYGREMQHGGKSNTLDEGGREMSFMTRAEMRKTMELQKLYPFVAPPMAERK